MIKDESNTKVVSNAEYFEAAKKKIKRFVLTFVKKKSLRKLIKKIEMAKASLDYNPENCFQSKDTKKFISSEESFCFNTVKQKIL